MGRRWKIAIGVLVGLVALLSLNAIALNAQTKDAETTVEGARIIDAFGGQLQVTDSGNPQGTPLVLLHGYLGSLRWWDQILSELERDHRVIRIDLLGHGGSEKPSSGYSIEDQAGAVASALSELAVSRAVLIGHSLGFSVAVGVAEQSPELAAMLVNIDEAPDDGYGETPLRARLVDIPLLGQAMSRLTPDFAIRDGVRDEAFAPGFNLANGFEDPDQIVTDVNAMTYKSLTKTDDAERDYCDETPLDIRIRQLGGIPLLVIFGSEDQIFDPPEEAAEAYEEIPGAAVSIVEGAGHSPQVEKPDETGALILEFAASPGDDGTPPSRQEFEPPNKQSEPKMRNPAK